MPFSDFREELAQPGSLLDQHSQEFGVMAVIVDCGDGGVAYGAFHRADHADLESRGAFGPLPARPLARL
jgi:hypothetical protein